MSALRGLVQNPVWLPQSEGALRDECLQAWQAASPQQQRNAIRTIAVPGALDLDFSDPLNRDAQLLGMTISYLLHNDQLVDPNVVIDPVRFCDGRDFLRETHHADMVFIPRILARNLPERFTFTLGTSYDASTGVRDPFANAVSPINDPGHWQQRCLRGKTRLVVTFGGNQDISSDTFAPNTRFQTLIPTPDLEMDVFTATIPANVLYGRYVDLPYSWMGISATQQHLAQWRALSKSPSILGNVVRGQLKAEDLRPVPLTRRVASVFPRLRAMFELKGNHVGLQGLHHEKAYAEGHHRPQHRMHPQGRRNNGI